jgi:hypothetical protein
MAKAKKLTKKEHESLVKAIESLRTNEGRFNSLARQLAEAQFQFSEANSLLKNVQSELSALQSTLMEKYGNVNINVETGELIEPDKE